MLLPLPALPLSVTDQYLLQLVSDSLLSVMAPVLLVTPFSVNSCPLLSVMSPCDGACPPPTRVNDG